MRPPRVCSLWCEGKGQVLAVADAGKHTRTRRSAPQNRDSQSCGWKVPVLRVPLNGFRPRRTGRLGGGGGSGGDDGGCKTREDSALLLLAVLLFCAGARKFLARV